MENTKNPLKSIVPAPAPTPAPAPAPTPAPAPAPAPASSRTDLAADAASQMRSMPFARKHVSDRPIAKLRPADSKK